MSETDRKVRRRNFITIASKIRVQSIHAVPSVSKTYGSFWNFFTVVNYLIVAIIVPFGRGAMELSLLRASGHVNNSQAISKTKKTRIFQSHDPIFSDNFPMRPTRLEYLKPFTVHDFFFSHPHLYVYCSTNVEE